MSEKSSSQDRQSVRFAARRAGKSMEQARQLAMQHIPMVGDGPAYRQRIEDFVAGYMKARNVPSMRLHEGEVRIMPVAIRNGKVTLMVGEPADEIEIPCGHTHIVKVIVLCM